MTSPLDLAAFEFTWEESVPVSASDMFFTQAWGTYVAPDRLACNVGQALGTGEDHEVVGFVETVTIGDVAWIDEGDGWRETTPTDPAVETARFYCASAWTPAVTGTPDADFGEPATHDGVAVRQGDLVAEGFSSEIIVGDVEVSLEEFEVWITEPGMAVRFRYGGIGNASGLAASVGIQYEGSADEPGAYIVRGEIVRMNDPGLEVNPPETEE